MTKQQFRARWESDENGGSITFDEVADCAIAWGLCQSPKARPMHVVMRMVVEAAGVEIEGGPEEEDEWEVTGAGDQP